MDWTRMLREKINRNCTSISYMKKKKKKKKKKNDKTRILFLRLGYSKIYWALEIFQNSNVIPGLSFVLYLFSYIFPFSHSPFPFLKRNFIYFFFVYQTKTNAQRRPILVTWMPRVQTPLAHTSACVSQDFKAMAEHTVQVNKHSSRVNSLVITHARM